MTVIDDYIFNQPESVQPRLQEWATLLREALPQADERLAYGMPAFYLQGKAAVYFAANRQHVGFYPTPATITEFSEELQAFHTSKGAIQFPYDQPLPAKLVRKMAQWRAAHMTDERATAAAPVARQRETMPDAVAAALAAHGLQEAYDARPPYQQNDYLRWLGQAKRPATQQARLAQLLTELAAGNVYMKMPWQPRKR
ncbi:YdeI/OmpD-associated family protein [Lacticaseibacillus mingshuiensis]|uniref:YdeI/OmpD-associated family protein n=1 Tax=Lacticaseibacillus mingshuiensis TaxID=2799574 RepID=A0ABW4CGV6_9LACO|nr:YdeI/OmpD-associated family protein [Lacticaseibacillus mingshuiensis]